jgi:hypothetical protein
LGNKQLHFQNILYIPEMKRGGVLLDPKAKKEVSTMWEVQLRSLPVSQHEVEGSAALTSGKSGQEVTTSAPECHVNGI